MKDDPQPQKISDSTRPAYSDGHPLDAVHYLECKIILKGDRFSSAESFHDFGKLVRRTADTTDVGFSTEDFKGLKPQIREVVFLDTEDFKLYNNALSYGAASHTKTAFS
jgi:hypothetical protein